MFAGHDLPDLETEASPLDVAASQRLAILCIVLLLLGVVGAIRYMSVDLPPLLETRDAAIEAVDAARLALGGDSIDGGTPAEERLTAAESRLSDASAAARRGWFRALGFAAGLIVILYFLVMRRKHVNTRGELVSAATLMIVLLGAVLLASRLVVQSAFPERDLPAWGALDLFILHFVACLIIPWTARESALPFTLLLLVWAVTFLVPHQPDPELVILDRVVGTIVSPIILLPGVGIAQWRWQRRREDAERLMLGQQVATMGGELSRARIVHDAMFPRPFDTGQVRFEYDYRPIAEIGGDYVHTHVCGSSKRVYLTLLDVAGHGLAAALTVNRLFGELERIRAEDPNAEPAAVMALLNRYINLTMAAHNLYATGCCIMLDPTTGETKWVNAGHPPALVRKGDGRVLEMAGTTMLLGALDWEVFDPNQQSARLEPGDVIIGYTDGAFEARNPAGQRFGLDQIRVTAGFNPPPRDWSKFIANAVFEHHGGNAEDDVLVASLSLRSLLIGELYHQDEPQSAEIEVESPVKVQQ